MRTRSQSHDDVKIRALVVTTWYPDTEAPSRTPFCLAHAHALVDVGIDVRVVHIDLSDSSNKIRLEQYQGIPTWRVPLRPRSALAWMRAWRLLRQELRHADVLHTMAFSSIMVAAPAWAPRRLPWVHTEHWNGVVNPRSVAGWWPQLAFLRRILLLPHAVTGVTAELRDAMSPFCRARATHTVPCVVPAPLEVAQLPAAPPIRIIAVGLLNDRKDPLTALDTIHWLVRRGYDVQFQWVGEGPLLDRAAAHADELGLAARVDFSGPVPPARIPELLSGAHIFFVPTVQENFFTAAAEAIVAGRMVVLPRTGGFTEYCTSANSMLADDRAPETLGRLLVSAMEQLPNLEPNAVSETIRDQFTSLSVGQQFLRIYLRVAS